MTHVSVCIVTYEPDEAELVTTLDSLACALEELRVRRGFTSSVYVVDNSIRFDMGSLAARFRSRLSVISGHGNIGFGQGHNLCLDRLGGLHLVLNPDVELAPDALIKAVDFMSSQPGCVLLSPSATWGNGERQYLCKRYPSLMDLMLRGFAPAWLKELFRKRLDRYEMRDVVDDEVFWGPKIVSGCFMLLRGDAFRHLDGFDPRFFLYFEDFDLSLRAASIGSIAYVPSVRIIHHGGHAARKGWRHVRMFARSGITFFNKHGWRLR
jgi:GT2 family glycosyltransferase